MRTVIKRYKNTTIKDTSEDKKSVKQLWRTTSLGNANIFKLPNPDNIEINQITSLIEEVERFYKALYQSSSKPRQRRI